MENHNTTSDLLIQEIREQSEREATSLLELAENEKKRILDEAKEKADFIRSEILKKAEQKAEGVKKKILSGVHLELKNQELQDREEMLSSIFSSVQERLDGYRKSEHYLDTLKSLILEGMEALDVTNVILTIGTIEKKILTSKVVDRFQKEIETQSKRKINIAISDQVLHDGGAIVMSEDRRIVFDNSFSARLKRLNHELRQIVIKKITE